MEEECQHIMTTKKFWTIFIKGQVHYVLPIKCSKYWPVKQSLDKVDVLTLTAMIPDIGFSPLL